MKYHIDHLLFILFISLLFLSCNDSNSNIYRNRLLEITLEFPEHWNIEKNSPRRDGDLSAVSGKRIVSNGNNAYFNLVYTIHNNGSLNEAIKQHNMTLVQVYGDYIQFDPKDIIFINDNEVHSQITINSSNPDYINKTQFYYFLSNEYYVVFSITANENDWTVVEEDIESIVTSLIFGK